MKITRLLTLICALMASLFCQASRAANIVWVSDNPTNTSGFSGPVAGTADDVFITNFLQTAGHNVVRYNSDNSAAVLLSQPDIDALNTNDLVIIGRSVGSAAFGGAQGTQWNTAITKPLICQSAFLTRSNLLGWFTGTDTRNGVPMPLGIVNPNDPENAYLFAGVALNGTNTVNNYDEALDANTTQTIDAPVAGGNILATGFATNRVIVEFPAGTPVRTGVNILAGYRLFFASGTREVAAVDTAGKDNLTPTGESIFMRAVALAINNGVAPNLGNVPSVVSQPASTNACVGLPIAFSASATGQDPLRYQWYFNDVTPIANATNATYSISSFQNADAGNYTVVVTNAVGVVTSAVAVASISGTGTIASAVGNQTICPGSPVTFTTTATGSGTLQYTWRKGGAVVQGPDGNNSFSIASVAPADGGAYSVTVVGDCNTVSNNFTLTVVAAPVITANPRSITVPMGNGTVFGVSVTSAGTLGYQWKTNGVDVLGATASTFSISNLTLGQNGLLISVQVSNCVSTALSSAATLTVTPIFGLSYDFDTPGQWTNAPYNWGPNTVNDWINFGAANNGSGGNPVSMGVVAAGGAQIQTFEVSTGGVGVALGGGALGHVFNNNIDSGALLLPTGFDFSSSGKVLTASIMMKLRNPQTPGTNTQIGFVTTTNYNNQFQGMNANDRQGFMSALLVNRIAANGSYALAVSHKAVAGTALLPALQAVVNSPTNNLNTTAGSLSPTGTNGWYRLTVQFMNVKGPGLASSNFTINATLQEMGPLGITPGNFVLGLGGPLVQTNGDMVNQTNLFFCMRNAGQQAGLDYWDSIFISTTNGPINFVAPLVDVSVPEGRFTTFKAMVDGDGPYTYQWFKNGTAIPGAGNWRYTTPPLRLSDNGAQYTVSVTSTNNTITSNPGTVTVTANPLMVVSAGSVDGGVVGVRFNELVNPATATVAANYLINGTPAITAQMRPNGSDVLLTPASTLTGAFTVSVSGVASLSGTALGASTTANGQVAGLIGYDVDANNDGFFTAEGAPTANGAVATYPGQSFSFGPGIFEITAGGHDIFSTFDGFRFVYKQITGDFDLKMRIPYQDALRFSQKAGFDARISLSAFSPQVGAFADAPSPQLNRFEATARNVWGGGGISWGTNTAALYPNAWLRFRRSGPTFLRYSSTNGVNWLCDGQFSPEPGALKWPDTIYVGIAGNCNVGGGAVQFPNHFQVDNYGDFAGYPGATIAINTQPANATVAAGATATFTVVATATGVPQSGLGGELTYVWQRTNSFAGGWTNMPNAGVTNAVFATPALFGGDNQAQYRVIVKAPGAPDVTSSLVTVTVTDSAAPTIATTGVVVPTNATDRIVVTFSEYVSATALNPANYVLTNSAGTVFSIANISFAWTGDRRTVIITTTGPLPSGTYGLRVSGVQDLGGQTIATVTRTFRQIQDSVMAPIVMDWYGALANAANLGDLTGNVRFIANTPDYTVYSNAFGWNIGGGFPAQGGPADNYGVRMYSYFVPTNNAQYTFWWRADDFARFSMNTNSDPLQSTNPAGVTTAQILGANNPNYSLTNSFTTPTLVAGQKYYTEFLFKEGGGGDGGVVMVTLGNTNGVTAPAQALTAGSDLFAFPDAVAQPPVAVSELYTNLLTTGIQANGNIPDYVSATNTVKFITSIPDMLTYQKYFGFMTNLGNSGHDNYLGKLYSYFVPPTNGNYKFWVRGDDTTLLFLNTNSVNSTDPAGKVKLYQKDAFGDANYKVAQVPSVTLVGGQRYYMEGHWREGGGGDGMTVAVRTGSDTGTPPNTEMIPRSMLEFPTNLARLGPVSFAQAGSGLTFTPVNPTVVESDTVTFFPRGVNGAPPYYFAWLKNGVVVQAANPINGAGGALVMPFYTTPPLTLADNGAVFSVVISNLFSVVTQSTTITVTGDVTPPAIATAVGSQFNTYVVVTFTEKVDPFTASQLSNYRVNGGVSVLSVTYDPVRKDRVTLRTSLQSPSTQYTVTVSGVRDLSQAGNALVNGTANFTAWGFGGRGTVFVEYWTNLLGASYAALENDPKYINNQPDGSYYTNQFAAGQFGAETGRNFWGARVTGLFMPPSNGLYRFFVRGDDGSKLYINTNGTDPNGAVLVAANLGANSGTWYNGQGAAGNNGLVSGSASGPISMTNGSAYFMQAIFKEGTGGDHLEVTMRSVDLATLTDYPPLGAPVVGDILGAGAFTTTGNPDVNKFIVTQVPPTELFLAENDPVNLVFAATTVPPSLTPYISYQWQRSNSVTGTFTNIPGATLSSLFFYAALSDADATYRLVATIPGTTLIMPTLIHVVTTDTRPIRIVSVSSLDGNTIGVAYSEPVDVPTGQESSFYSVNGGFPGVISATIQPTDPTKVILVLEAPITGQFTVDKADVYDRAAVPNYTALTSATGLVQNLRALDVGTAGLIGAGGYNALLPGSSLTFTNNGFDVSANGWGITNTVDGFHFTYREVTGNFDIKTRISKFLGADPWSKAGLMARPSTNGNSRMIYMAATPATIPGQIPNNFFAAQYRDADGAASGNLQNTVAPGYPNAWVRLQRSNTVFYGYWSTNGIDWTVLLQRDTATVLGGAFPDTLQVGLGTVSHDQTRALANNAYVEYRDLAFPQGATIVQQPQPTPLTLGIHQSVTFSNLIAAGNNIQYQWRRDGVAVANGNSANLTINNLAVSDSGFYTVAVFNNGGGAVSIPLQLIVTNTVLITTNDTLTATINTPLNVTNTVLTGNDFDLEGDPLSILAVYSPHTIATNFDGGALAGATLYGAAQIRSGIGIGGTTALVINDAAANSVGSMVINEITPGSKVLAFTASFMVRIADGNVEPADGLSFNFAADLPNSEIIGAENGVGTGFSFCIDNYRFAPYPAGGTANTAGMKVRYGGVDIVGIQTASVQPAWGSTTYVPISITVEMNGKLTVLVNGTNVFGNNITLPWVPVAGRFGIYARAGGSFETHWVDDLNIDLLAGDSARGGLVSLTNGNVVYTPPTGATGTDTFYYLATDGQLGGTNVGMVTVNISANSPIQITKPIYSGATFSASFATANGVTYIVEYKDSLNTPTWTFLNTVVGDGTVKPFTDMGPLPATRFYQIRVQP